MLTFKKVINQKENQLVINYLNAESPATSLNFIMDEKKIDEYKSLLGTHTDLIDSLWKELIEKIPIKCQAIFLGKAVLINPRTGVVFAIAEGTYPLLLRLSEKDKNELQQRSGKIILSNVDGIYADARKVGNDWIYCFSFTEGLKDYFFQAYIYSDDNQPSL